MLNLLILQVLYFSNCLGFIHVHPFFLATTLPTVHCKKWLASFPSPAGMSLTKLSLAGNNLNIPGQGKFG
jgi:hypothetical protein